MNKKFELPIEDFKSKTDVKAAVFELIDELNDMWKNSLKRSILKNALRTGQTIGGVFDSELPEKLNKYSVLTYVKGLNHRTDIDALCKEDSYYAVEIKSSSQKNYITPPGTKSHCNWGPNCYKHKTDEYSFYIYVPYQFCDKTSDKLIVPHFIAIGMLKPSDWKQMGTSGSGATISVETFREQFKIIWDESEL